MNENVGSYRWRILALLFFATTINYIDRQVLALVVTDTGFMTDTGLAGTDGKLNKELYGYLDAIFKGAYALGFLFMGNFLDKIGNKKGFSLALVIWSIAAVGHAVARNFAGLSFFRFLLGFGEAGNFPGCVKTVSEWFPKSERSLAVGIFNAGTNIGAILAPLIVPFLVINYNWQTAFVITGLLGFIWLIFWILIYQKPQDSTALSASELAHIQSDGEDVKNTMKWGGLFSKKQTWSFAAGKFLIDPVWFIYLTWLPTFFKEQHGVDLKSMFLPMLIIYLISDGGSVAGGWLSSYFIKIGKSTSFARRTTMLIGACFAVPIFMASQVSNIWVAIALISIAAAAHQWFSANLYAIVTDTFPKQATASVTGIGGTGGAIGGMIIAAASGVIYQNIGPWPLFAYGSVAYLTALAVVFGINKNLEKAQV
ncbi:MAG: MFS transporter [Cytophagales bacterium]|nr:MFS transporter [Cytophagales bacterium]